MNYFTHLNTEFVALCIMVAERFGDGDTCQISFDLDQVISLYVVLLNLGWIADWKFNR